MNNSQYIYKYTIVGLLGEIIVNFQDLYSKGELIVKARCCKGVMTNTFVNGHKSLPPAILDHHSTQTARV